MSSMQLCTQDRHRAGASFGAQEALSNPEGTALKALKSLVLLHCQARQKGPVATGPLMLLLLESDNGVEWSILQLGHFAELTYTLCLIFFIYKTGVIIIPTSRGCWRIA